MLEVLKFVGYAMAGGVGVYCAMRYAWKQYDAGYRAGRSDRRGLDDGNARRRG